MTLNGVTHPAPGLGSEHGPGPSADLAAPRKAGASPGAGGFWQQMGSPRQEREPSHARVSKQDGNSQSRLLNKKALSRAACHCGGGGMGLAPWDPLNPSSPARGHGHPLALGQAPLPCPAQGDAGAGRPRGAPSPGPTSCPSWGSPGCPAPAAGGRRVVAGGRHAVCVVCVVRAAHPSPPGPLTDNQFPRAGERHTVQTHQALNANFPNAILQSPIIESQ